MTEKNININNESNVDQDIDIVANLYDHVKRAREHGNVVLIDTIHNNFTNLDTRIFYIPSEDSFVLGLDAVVEGFTLPDGTELVSKLDNINRSYLNNSVNLPSINFEDEETFLNFVANLWLSYKLHNTYSSYFDPTFTLFATMQSAYRNGLAHFEAGVDSDLLLYNVSEKDAIHYNGLTRTISHKVGDEVKAVLVLDDVDEEQVVIYQMADFANTVTAQVLHMENSVDDSFQE